MNRILFISLTVMACVALSYGQGRSQVQSVAEATKTDTIQVPTIQCGSCRMTIEKALNGLDGVKTAKVDLKKKIVAVEFIASKLDLGRIESAITKVGYAANDKKADAEAYEKLDECCKLPNDQK